MKSLIFFRRAEPQRGEAVVFASLGLAGLAGIVLATSSMFDFMAGSQSVAEALVRPPAAVVESGDAPESGVTNAGDPSVRQADSTRPVCSNAPTAALPGRSKVRG